MMLRTNVVDDAEDERNALDDEVEDTDATSLMMLKTTAMPLMMLRTNVVDDAEDERTDATSLLMMKTNAMLRMVRSRTLRQRR